MKQLPKRRFTAEFRQEAVRLVEEADVGVTEAARRLQISPKTLGNWVYARRATITSPFTEAQGPGERVADAGQSAGSGERAAEDGAGDLKKSDGVLREGVNVRYATVDFFHDSYPIEVLCAALSVSHSGYNQWRRRSPSQRQRANEQLLERIRRIHAQSRSAYGSPRIHQELKKRGMRVGKERIRKLMQVNQIVGRSPGRFCRTTDSEHGQPIVANLLGQNFQCHTPDTVWLADITYVATAEGFLYVAAMKDLCTRKIVGWSMSHRMDTALVIDALHMAIDRQAPGEALIVHSDRGAQYASHEFRGTLAQHRMRQSMSGLGNCYDNAPMESFFSSLKTERLEQERFSTKNQARVAIFDYIEGFYNPVRLHSGIGYNSPNQYEAMLKAA